jgi:hypothetical protein
MAGSKSKAIRRICFLNIDFRPFVGAGKPLAQAMATEEGDYSKGPSSLPRWIPWRLSGFRIWGSKKPVWGALRNMEKMETTWHQLFLSQSGAGSAE